MPEKCSRRAACELDTPATIANADRYLEKQKSFPHNIKRIMETLINFGIVKTTIRKRKLILNEENCLLCLLWDILRHIL